MLRQRSPDTKGSLLNHLSTELFDDVSVAAACDNSYGFPTRVQKAFFLGKKKKRKKKKKKKKRYLVREPWKCGEGRIEHLRLEDVCTDVLAEMSQSILSPPPSS